MFLRGQGGTELYCKQNEKMDQEDTIETTSPTTSKKCVTFRGLIEIETRTDFSS